MGPVSIVNASDFIASARDISVGIASIVTAAAAWLGLTRWSRELKGKARFDAARNLARATYRLRDHIRNSRSPLVSAEEFPAGYRGRCEDPKEEANAWAHVYRGRWEPVWTALQDFDANILEAEALWGPEIRVQTDKLRACVAKLRSAIDAIVSDASTNGEDFKHNPEFGMQMRSIAHASLSDDTNTLTKEIKEAVSEIEKILTPHLQRK